MLSREAAWTEELGVDLDEHIAFVIAALTGVAAAIGLSDRPPS